MVQQEIIFKEIQELKSILSIVIGTSDRGGEDRSSAEAIQEAAKLFKKMSIERGDWVEEDNRVGRGTHCAQHQPGTVQGVS